MQIGVVDTTVLYAAGNRRAERHDQSLQIVRAADSGDVPRLRIPDVVLVETMNGLARDVGHETATEMLDRLRRGCRFDLVREVGAVWERGLATFEATERLSLADGVIVAALRHHDVEYLYSFDDDFDGLDGVTRLSTATDPYAPG